MTSCMKKYVTPIQSWIASVIDYLSTHDGDEGQFFNV